MTSRLTRRRLLGSAALAVLGAACAPAEAAVQRPDPAAGRHPRATLVVFAAASLADALAEVGDVFERERPDVRVSFSFAGSQQLRLQLEQGARADVFAPADRTSLDRAAASGLVVGPGEVLARNRLLVVAPATSRRVRTLADLATPGVRLVLAHSEVPAGAYARAALAALDADHGFGPGYSARALANVVSEEPNVRQVLAKVRLGEADAAFVYSTDAVAAERAAPGSVRRIDLSEDVAPEVVYPIAVASGARRPDLAAAFVRETLGAGARAVLLRHGFLPPVETAERDGRTSG